MGTAYQKVTRVSRTHVNRNNIKSTNNSKRVAGKRSPNAKNRRATRRGYKV